MKCKKTLAMAVLVVLGVLVVWWVWLADTEVDIEMEDNAEYEEQERIQDFFTELKSNYGYLYSSESFQLFLQVDEALLEGELTGNLLVIEHTNDEDSTYKETNYPFNGITDGNIIELYTSRDGKSTKLVGEFYNGAARFDLSFWMAEDQVLLEAITKEEFQEFYDNATNQ